MPRSTRKGVEGGDARDCGDFDAHCESGYTFFRRDTQVRSTADQADAAHEWVYIVYDPSKPGTEVPTGTTYGSIEHGHRQPVGDLLPALRRRDRGQDRADA